MSCPARYAILVRSFGSEVTVHPVADSGAFSGSDALKKWIPGLPCTRPPIYILQRLPRLATVQSVMWIGSVSGANPSAGSKILISFPDAIFLRGFAKPKFMKCRLLNADKAVLLKKLRLLIIATSHLEK